MCLNNSPEDHSMIPLSPMDSSGVGGSASSPPGGVAYLSPKNPVVRTHSNKSSTAGGGNGNSGDKVSRVLIER